MSARHVQRLEQALGQKKKSVTQNSDSDEAELMEEDERPKKNAFSKLMVDVYDSSSSEDEEDDEKQDAKNETKDREETKMEEMTTKKNEEKKNSSSATNSSKNKKKKKKGKQEKQRKENEEDKILEELAKQALELNASNKVDESTSEKENRFQFSAQSLDADKEVKRRLGRALGGASSARAGNQQPGVQQQLRQRGRGQMRMVLPPGMGTTAAISSIPRVLVTPDGDWFNPPTFASGEGARMVRVEGTSNVVTFEASSSYLAAQAHFRELVKTFDPNEIIQMIQTHPFHVDSLLQLVDVFSASSQNETAQMMLRRALFTLESWCSPQFRSSLGSGQFLIQLPEISSRFGIHNTDEEEWLLSYDGNKDCGLNGAFLRAISLSMRVAGRRDCFETAFNLAKMLLSLSYERDPCFALLSVDYYAIKAKEYEWVFSSHTPAEIASLPCVAFGLALALFHQSRMPNSTLERAKADQALISAISRFPQYAENVLTKAERSIPANLNKIFQQHGAIPDMFERLCTLSYARQQSLWDEDTIGWMAGLLNNPSAIFPAPDRSTPQLPNVQRYARCKLADLSDKVDLIPREELVADEAQRMEFAAANDFQDQAQEEGASTGRRLLDLNTNDLLLFALSAFPMFHLPPRREDGQEQENEGHEDEYDEQQDWPEDAD